MLDFNRTYVVIPTRLGNIVRVLRLLCCDFLYCSNSLFRLETKIEKTLDMLPAEEIEEELSSDEIDDNEDDVDEDDNGEKRV